jgi:FkbH-like protein
MADAQYRVVSLALADRFGDNGVVGLALLRAEPREWTIQTLLMSCRVLGRTVEDSFIKWIAAQARSAGAERLVGLVRLTAKNRPFAGFYSACGFTRAGNDGDVERWILQLAQAEIRTPDWISFEVSEHGRDALSEPRS